MAVSSSVLVLISFILLSALCLWAVIYSKGPVVVKFILICTVPFFGFVVKDALTNLAGYPLHDAPPTTAAIVYTLVQEPDWIYIWAVPNGAREPRAYRIKYTRTLHKQADAINSNAKNRTGKVGVKKVGPKGVYRFYHLPPLGDLKPSLP